MNHRVKQFRPACDSVAISRPDTNGIATAQFKVSKFAGDNYVIKATIYHDDGPAIRTRTWKSKPLTVWKKFTVEVDAMKRGSKSNGVYYPWHTFADNHYGSIGRAYEEVFIELDFADDQVGTTKDGTVFVRDLDPNTSTGLESVLGYAQTNRTTNADLHILGVKKVSSVGGKRRGIHAAIAVEAYESNPLRVAFAVAHELFHTLTGDDEGRSGGIEQPQRPPDSGLCDENQGHFREGGAIRLRRDGRPQD